MDGFAKKLGKLFNELNMAPRPTVATLGVWATNSLKILQGLEEDQGLAGIIARDLRIILIPAEAINTEEDLREDFLAIDAGLESSLRGFANLLDFVLLENSIKRDASQRLANIAEAKIWGLPFQRLLQQLNVYQDLSLAFGVEQTKVPSLLFLHGLRELVALARGVSTQEAHSMVSEWLGAWLGPQHALKRLFALDLEHPNFLSSLNEENELYTAAILAYLCHKSLNEHPVAAADMPTLDRALRVAGFEGIGPLVEAGFLEVG